MELSISIRPACLDDCDTIATFNTQLAWETERKKLDPVTIRAGVETLLCHPERGRYFVACVNEQIAGQMMHTREWSDWRNGEIWWLQSVYVDPQFRRRGLFRALYQHLRELAQKTPQIVGLRLYAERHNHRALESYLSLGMSDAGYSVMEQMFHRL